jgi:hypothetical protein
LLRKHNCGWSFSDGRMPRLFAIFLFFGFCVVLPLGLLRVFYDLLQRIGQHGPASHNQASIIQEGAEQSGR